MIFKLDTRLSNSSTNESFRFKSFQSHLLIVHRSSQNNISSTYRLQIRILIMYNNTNVIVLFKTPTTRLIARLLAYNG